MYQTIEAIYDDGIIIPLHDKVHAKKARVLLTIVEEMDEPLEKGASLSELAKYKGVFNDYPEGMQYQKELRDEW